MESLNRTAVELVDEAMDFADALGIAVHHLENDAVVLDFGVEAAGGLEAGLQLAELATGGLATVGTRFDDVAGGPRPHVELATDHPALCLLASQRSGWSLAGDGYDGRGCGPAQLHGDAAREVGVPYVEEFDLTVLCVESTELPGPAVAETVAEAAGVPTSGVYLPTAPTASVAGSVAMAARAAEVGLLRWVHCGGDPTAVRSATGDAPVVPIARDEHGAVSRTNDALAYGGRVHLVADEGIADPDALAFQATGVQEQSVGEIVAGADGDLNGVDQGLFAPAQVTLDVIGGDTHVTGAVDSEALVDAFA